MPASFRKAIVQSGEIVTPHELNTEVVGYLGLFNGNMDRDNITADLLTGAKFALDTFHNIVREKTSATQQLVFTARHERQQWDPWPDINGDDWSVDITTDDTELEIAISTSFADNAAAAADCPGVIGIRLDGIIVAKSGISFGLMRDNLALDAMVPVRAGPHKIEPVFSLHHNGAMTVDFLERCVWVREVRR